MPRTASAYVAGRVHVFAQREDLVVDPAGAEDPLLRFVPARRTGRELVLLPDHDPGRPVGMRDPYELAAEPLELDLAEREAQHEPVSSVLRAQRELQLAHVEPAREVLDRAVVGRESTDAQGVHPQFFVPYRYHLS